MKKTNRMKRMICMVMVAAMAWSVNLSAAAASAGNNWWGDSSGTQTGFIQDWMDSCIGNGSIVGQRLAAPANIRIVSHMTESSRTMEVSWDKAEGAESYIIQKSVTADFTGDEVKEYTVNGTQMKFSTKSVNGIYHLPAHRTYYFRLKSVSGYRQSAWSEVAVSYGDLEKE